MAPSARGSPDRRAAAVRIHEGQGSDPVAKAYSQRACRASLPPETRADRGRQARRARCGRAPAHGGGHTRYARCDGRQCRTRAEGTPWRTCAYRSRISRYSSTERGPATSHSSPTTSAGAASTPSIHRLLVPRAHAPLGQGRRERAGEAREVEADVLGELVQHVAARHVHAAEERRLPERGAGASSRATPWRRAARSAASGGIDESGGSADSQRSAVTPFASGSFAALRVERASRSRSARDIARGAERSGNGSWRSGSYVPSRESSAAEMRFSATRHQGRADLHTGRARWARRAEVVVARLRGIVLASSAGVKGHPQACLLVEPLAPRLRRGGRRRSASCARVALSGACETYAVAMSTPVAASSLSKPGRSSPP